MKKQYKQLLSFGCSFTYGGGLNNPHYHNFLNQNHTDLDIYAHNHSFGGYLSRLLNCSFVNYGKSQASNGFILKNVYDICEKLSPETASSTIITVQTTFLNRMNLYDVANNIEVVLNNPDSVEEEYIKNYYTSWITNFFSVEYEWKLLIQNVTTLQSWLREKNIDFIFLAWETQEPTNLFYNFTDGCNSSMGCYAHKNKLLISDIPNIPFIDHHVTELGNEHIANLLFEHLNSTDKKYAV